MAEAHRRSCGMDVHKDTIVVCVLPPVGSDGKAIRKTYGTFRNDHTTTIQAYPVRTNQFVQVKTFSSRYQRTYVPHAIYFNLNLDSARPRERIDVKVDQTTRSDKKE